MRFQGRGWRWFKNGLTLVLAASFALAFAGRIFPPGNRLPEGMALPTFKLANLHKPGDFLTPGEIATKGMLINFWAPW